MSTQDRFVCIIPAKDEESRVGRVVESFMSTLNSMGLQGDVIVVDDGSADGTAIEAKTAGASVVRHGETRGLAEAFRTGTLSAMKTRATCFIHADADGQHRASDLDSLIGKWKSEGGLVVGNRLESRPASMSPLRYEWNLLLSRTVSEMTGKLVPDSQSGFRVFSRRVAELEMSAKFTYTQEQILRTVSAGIPVSSTPISVVARVESESRIASDPVSYLLNALSDIQAARRDLGMPAAW